MSECDRELRQLCVQSYGQGVDGIDAFLLSLSAQVEINGAMLLDQAGHMIAASGEFSSSDPDYFVALCCASYSALGQVLGRVRLGQPRGLEVLGETGTLSILPVGSIALLVVSHAGSFSEEQREECLRVIDSILDGS